MLAVGGRFLDHGLVNQPIGARVNRRLQCEEFLLLFHHWLDWRIPAVSCGGLEVVEHSLQARPQQHLFSFERKLSQPTADNLGVSQSQLKKRTDELKVLEASSGEFAHD
jgi:hypothetical protein